MNPTTVHIDTSLQIERQKAKKLADPIERALLEFKFRSTSTFARKEFKRAWLQDLAWIYKTIPECDDISDIYTKIDKSFWPAFSKRRQQRCVQAMAKFFKLLPRTTPVGEALIKMRSHVAEAILCGFMWWERSVTYEFDGTGCIRAREEPTRAENGFIDAVVSKCKPTRILCKVHSFFEEHRENFEKIKKAVEEQADASEELKAAAAAIGRALNDPRFLCDDANCRRVSDSLIALDGLSTEVFAANNPREWNLIAQVLGKPLINPAVPVG